MSRYKKNDVDLVEIYTVEIDYYLDETVFNGEYLKNKDGQLVYFGLQNVDGDYIDKLSDEDLTSCITSSDDNYTIKLEKVDNTAAKIFINKPKNKLTLDKRYTYASFYYNDNMFLHISYIPTMCSYKHIFYIYKLEQMLTIASFTFNNLYYVVNYNGTGGVIDLNELKKARTIDITSNDLGKKLLYSWFTPDNIYTYINELIYTYYSYLGYWYLYEDGYKPKDFISEGYDKIYTELNKSVNIFDYSQNKIATFGNINQGNDFYLYFCAINDSNNQVIPVFRMNTSLIRKADDIYTVYIVK